MGPISGVSNINENSARHAIDISGALSISPLRILMHTQHVVSSANAGSAYCMMSVLTTSIDHPIFLVHHGGSTYGEASILAIRPHGWTSRHKRAVGIFRQRQRRRD